jgi:toxin ParE1/3/4
MARVVITNLADADTADILDNLVRDAGPLVASDYNTRIERLYDRLANAPESYQVRPKLGANIRVGVVFPYLVIYRYLEVDDRVSVIRVVDGRRNITRRFLRGG